MNGLLDPRYLNSDEVRNRNFSVFRLPDIKGSRAFFVVKIEYFLVVDFIERDKNFTTSSIFKGLHDHLQRSREYSSLLAGKQMVNVLFIVLAKRDAVIG